jgi:hypothetical protein
MTEDEARARIAEKLEAFKAISDTTNIVTPEYKLASDEYYDAVKAYNDILPAYLRSK